MGDLLHKGPLSARTTTSPPLSSLCSRPWSAWSREERPDHSSVSVKTVKYQDGTESANARYPPKMEEREGDEDRTNVRLSFTSVTGSGESWEGHGRRTPCPPIQASSEAPDPFRCGPSPAASPSGEGSEKGQRRGCTGSRPEVVGRGKPATTGEGRAPFIWRQKAWRGWGGKRKGERKWREPERARWEGWGYRRGSPGNMHEPRHVRAGRALGRLAP